ncbi:MAG: DUF3098 domain-containing protein [Chlorobi bacterium]|nr:DUF3098 domain-containing protein [Chlorobiota bacterium]
MPKQKQRRKTAKRRKVHTHVIELPGRENYILILVGIAVIVLGYILMAMGGLEDAISMVISPLVLILGYCVVVPIGILYRKKKTQAKE